VLVITHDLELAASLPRRVRMRDGRIEDDSRTDTASPAAASSGTGVGVAR
jgi:putative ABC transport system ATP-binding protein